MKLCIVGQSYNESNRIIDWIRYHRKAGVDDVLIFDDLSIDGTYDLVKDYIDNIDGNVTLLNTDKSAKTNVVYTNPNQYSFEDLNQRLLRSYNFGLNLLKERYKDELVVIFFLDIDEYMVPCNFKSLKEEIQDLDLNKYTRLLVSSYDIKPPIDDKFENSGVPVYIQSNLTWTDDLRNKKGSFKNRTKFGIVANSDCVITSVHTGDLRTCEDWVNDNCIVLTHKYQKPVKGHNWTYDVINTATGENWPCTNDIENEFTMIYPDRNRIKLLHFRNFPPSEIINDEYDFQDEMILKIMND